MGFVGKEGVRLIKKEIYLFVSHRSPEYRIRDFPCYFY